MPSALRVSLNARFAIGIVAIALLFCSSSPWQAGSYSSTNLIAQVPAKELPRPSDYVSDFAHVLSPGAVVRVDRVCGQLDHSKADTQVAVVTIRTLGGVDIADYAKELANTWGIGRKVSNRGVLLLFVIDDHKWRTAVGHGLEGILTDAKAAKIGRDMIPLLRGKDFDGAVTLCVNEVARVVAANPVVKQKSVRESGVR